MDEHDDVLDLVTRVRKGDQQAATELFRRYESVIRRKVRVWVRMQDPRLVRVFDSLDICQSVLGSFFARTALGQYQFEHPQQIVGLLVQMARHKLAHQVSKLQAGRRDIRRQEALSGAHADGLAAPSGSCALENQELLEEMRRRLTEEERQVADRRAAGCAWEQVAAELGGTAETRRKQLGRAIDRVVRELGLDGD